MKTLNKQAQKVFEMLIDGLENGYKKVDNSNGAFMPVSIDFICKRKEGTVYSIAHNFIQNGDLCTDPDMTFLRTESGFVVPLTFEMNYMRKYDEAAWWNENDQFMFSPRLQADITRFANTWMKNIKNQQFRKAA